MIRTIFIIASIILFSMTLYSQEKIISLTDDEKEEIIETICNRLNRFYVFPDIATKMEIHIKAKQNADTFEKINDPVEFAGIITQELRSVCNDKHLSLFFGNNPDLQTRENKDLKRILDKVNRENQNYGLNSVEVLPGNVGYMNIRTLMFYEETKEIISAAMKFLSNSNAIIFDLRDNTGGDTKYMTYLFSYFFENPTHINSIYRRDRDLTAEYWTEKNITGKKMTDIPLYVLINKNTFSGAEEFAYDLQALKRATIIGEVSAGGANPASSFVVYKDLRISIPLGRAINPITSTNWEGVGVKPDIEVQSDSALTTAIKLARDTALKYHEMKKNRIIANYNEFLTDITNAEKLLKGEISKETDSLVNLALNKALTNNLFTQAQINQMGYDYLGQEKFGFAIAVLKFNVSTFPESANAYDSLGEAYMLAGENEPAIENYEKSLRLNPGNKNAVESLKKLKEKN